MTPRLAATAAALVVSACATIPSGPSVMALPGTGKNFDQFRADDNDCRHYALLQVGGDDAQRTANDAAIKNAMLGALIGAAAGAAIGGRDAAGVGAGAGLVVGSASGAGQGQYSGREAQRRYDAAYVQCMYAKGQKVPVHGSMIQSSTPASAPAATPVPANAYPPPPAGNPPPPPPR